MNSGTVFAGKDGTDRHDVRKSNDAGNRCDVVDEVEAELFVERRVDGVHCAAEQERVAVGGCANDRFGCQIAARAGPVLDNDRLMKLLRHRLADQTRNDVEVPAGCKANQDMHRPRPGRLATLREVRHGRQGLRHTRPDVEILDHEAS